METEEREVREMYHRITRTLIDRKLWITTMESATSGQIASLITDTEGSSAVMKGAFVTYSNEAKILQGVPAEIIGNYGVYSGETSHAMAEACRRAYGADIGIGVTGTMGNVDPNNHDSIPGVLYYTVNFRGESRDCRIEIPPQPDRLAYKLKAAGYVGRTLMEMLESQG